MPEPAHDDVDAKKRAVDPLARSVSKAARGDHDALAEVYDAMASRVYGSALHLLRDTAQAEEVTVEVFVDVWQRSGTFDRSRGSASSWVMSIAHRRAVDRMRSTLSEGRLDSTRVSPCDPSGPAPAFEPRASPGAATIVRDALATLPEVQRRALELTYLDGNTYSDASRTMQTSPDTTTTRVKDALTGLRQRLLDVGALST